MSLRDWAHLRFPLRTQTWSPKQEKQQHTSGTSRNPIDDSTHRGIRAFSCDSCKSTRFLLLSLRRVVHASSAWIFSVQDGDTCAPNFVGLNFRPLLQHFTECISSRSDLVLRGTCCEIRGVGIAVDVALTSPVAAPPLDRGVCRPASSAPPFKADGQPASFFGVLIRSHTYREAW